MENKQQIKNQNVIKEIKIMMEKIPMDLIIKARTSMK